MPPIRWEAGGEEPPPPPAGGQGSARASAPRGTRSDPRGAARRMERSRLRTGRSGCRAASNKRSCPNPPRASRRPAPADLGQSALPRPGATWKLPPQEGPEERRSGSRRGRNSKPNWGRPTSRQAAKHELWQPGVSSELLRHRDQSVLEKKVPASGHQHTFTRLANRCETLIWERSPRCQKKLSGAATFNELVCRQSETHDLELAP